MTTQLIELTQRPAVPGLSFRHYRGEEDIPAMIDVINAAKLADEVDRTDTLESMATWYRNLVNCDPYQDMCMVTVNEQMVGYTRVWWSKQEDGLTAYISIGMLHPAHRRKRIGTAMLNWAQLRLHEIAQNHGEPRRVFRTFIDGGEVGAKVLLESDGYLPITFGAEMSRSIEGQLPDHPLPDGLEVRPVEPEQLRVIWEADAEAFRDHWGSRRQTEIDWRRFLERPNGDTTLWRIAWEGDRVVGQVRSFIDPDENAEYRRLRGYTEDISTARDWRGRGVARALISQSMRALRERGMTEAALGVHTQNPTGAFHLYSSLGYQVVSTSTVYEKPF